MPKTIRWAILGTGGIAKKFAKDLGDLPNAKLTAVGSRNPETAEAFGSAFNVPFRYGSYEALYQSTEYDILYIASPHSHHHSHMLAAIAEGKHVFCEKAFTLTEKQAAEVFAAAKAKGVYAAEAMWSRFLPANVELKSRIDQGELGDLTTAWAFFGSRFPDEWNLSHRIFNPALGGGAGTDLGVYSVSFLSYLANDAQPLSISAQGTIFAPSGVDAQLMITLSYPGDFLAVAGAAIRARLSDEGFVAGTKGSVRIPHFWNPDDFYLTIDNEVTHIERPRTMGGYAYEAKSVMEDLLAGRTESPVVPQKATLFTLRAIDQARHAIGFYYPGEK